MVVVLALLQQLLLLLVTTVKVTLTLSAVTFIAVFALVAVVLHLR